MVVWGSESLSYLSLLSTRVAPLTSFYTLRFYGGFLGKSPNLSPSTMFLLYVRQLSPREVKQLGRYLISDNMDNHLSRKQRAPFYPLSTRGEV